MILKGWDSREGSPTAVIVHDETLWIHTNLGWISPSFEGTAVEAAEALAESWGLSPIESERKLMYLVGIEPVGRLLGDGRTDCCNAEPTSEGHCRCCDYPLERFDHPKKETEHEAR